jgi:hypothetical protein
MSWSEADEGRFWVLSTDAQVVDPGVLNRGCPKEYSARRIAEIHLYYV